MIETMYHVPASSLQVVESIQQYGGYALFGILLLPWVLLALCLPTMIRRAWFERKQINRVLARYQRIEQGRCPDCGYDLRGSPDRCPECGHPIPWYRLAGEEPKP
jgi:hypothetical protein